MSLIKATGIAPVDSNGERLVLEPLDCRQPLPVLEDPEALDRERSILVGALTAKGYSQAETAAILGVSTRTIKRRWASVRPGMPTPRLTPVTGVDPDWRPETEADWRSVPELCSRCGAEVGPIQPGTPLVCLACGRSGYDHQVAADLEEDRRVEARREECRREEAALRRAARKARTSKRP